MSMMYSLFKATFISSVSKQASARRSGTTRSKISPVFAPLSRKTSQRSKNKPKSSPTQGSLSRRQPSCLHESSGKNFSQSNALEEVI
jgi:hypothetical protein